MAYDRMRDLGLVYEDVPRRAPGKITASNVHQVLNGLRNPTPKSVVQISQALNLDINAALQESGFGWMTPITRVPTEKELSLLYA